MCNDSSSRKNSSGSSGISDWLWVSGDPRWKTRRMILDSARRFLPSKEQKPLLSSEGWLSTVATINEVTLRKLRRGIGPLIPEEGVCSRVQWSAYFASGPICPWFDSSFFSKKNFRDNFDCSISNQQQSQYSYGRKNGKQRFKNTVNTHA